MTWLVRCQAREDSCGDTVVLVLAEAVRGNHLPPVLSFPETERSGRRAKGKKSDSKRKGREGSKGSPEKKEKMKAGPDSVLGQLGE